jgi:hypothetical protein
VESFTVKCVSPVVRAAGETEKPTFCFISTGEIII